MTNKLWMITLFVASMALAADRKTDLSGTWVLDREKSDLGAAMERGGRAPGGGGGFPGGRQGGRMPGGGQRPRGGGFPGGGGLPEGAELTIDIHQSETSVEVRRSLGRENDQGLTHKFMLDGSQSRNPVLAGRGEFISRSSWEKGKLVNLGGQTVSTPNGEMQIAVKEEYAISEDGSVLTLKTTRTTPRGEITTKMVFNRKAEPK